MRDYAMLRLLLRQLSGAITLCIFDKFRGPTAAEKRHWEEQSVCESGELIINKKNLIYLSRISENS
jgi:hypothetical protein